MLLNIIRPGEIISVKLTTGEEVIGKLSEDVADKLVLDRPVVLTAAPQGMALVPYLMTADPENQVIHFSKGHVIATSKTQDNLAKQYTQQTTGIVV